jgi:hypothetical protein
MIGGRRPGAASPSPATRRLAVIALVIALGATMGCRTLTGRAPGQWADDRTVTAKVKARLASTGMANLTRVHVDTYDGVVYLTGGVDSREVKWRVEEAAQSVPAVRLVVNNLHVAGDEVVAASPRTDVAVVPRGARVDWARALAPDIARLEVESGTPAWTRYAGLDEQGRRIATVFAVSGADLRERGIVDVPARLPVARFDVYPETGGMRYFLVFWHEDEEDHATAH